MIALALLTSLASASAGFDVDSVGLSALERSAIVERARTELGDVRDGAELVDAPGLAQCNADSPEANASSSGHSGSSGKQAHVACARAALDSAGAVAGAAVRVVKVLQVVRVELTIVDREGRAVATSLRTLDVEGAAKGPLFDDSARASLASLAPRTRTGAPNATTAQPGEQAARPPSQVPSASSTMTYAALGAGAAGVGIALIAGALATNEALLANSPASSGDEKERARIFGPIATTATVLGVAIAVAAPIVLLSLD